MYFYKPTVMKMLKIISTQNFKKAAIRKAQSLFNLKEWNFFDKVLYEKLIAIIDPTVITRLKISNGWFAQRGLKNRKFSADKDITL